MLHRIRLLALLLMAVACAPSVPRMPAEKVGTTDAAPDRPPDLPPDRPPDRPPDLPPDLPPAPDSPSDGHPEGRAAPIPGVDARVEVPAGNEVRAQSDAGDSAGSDAETRADAGVDLQGDDGTSATPPRAGELVIDELLVNPAGTDTNREWLEIVNVTTRVLDLRLLHVADAASEVAIDAGMIGPGGILVVGQSLDPTKNGGAPVDLSFGNTISLNNAADSISLCLGPCADGQILNQVTWTSDLGPAYDGHAAMVDLGSGVFCPADQPFGSAGSFGSPGAANPTCGN